MSPGELCGLRLRPDLPMEDVRCMVPPGQGRGEVFAVYLRLRDNRRLIWYRDGRIVEAAA